MQHANITIAYNNSIILCIADFRSQLNAARTTRQRSARVVVGSVLVPRGLVCLVRSIIHVCTCTIQPTLHKRLAPLVVGSWCIIPRPGECSCPLWLSLFHAPARLYYVSQRHSHGNKSKHLFVGTLHRLVALCATFIHMVFAFVLRLILPTLFLAVYIYLIISLQP